MPTDISFNEEFDVEYAMVDMERSMRRGGENSARFDFSTRTNISGASFGIFKSWLAGLRNNARFDVSRVAVVGVGIMSAMLLAAFLDEPGVFRPGVRRPRMPNVRLLGVAGLAFFINFLQNKKKCQIILNDFFSAFDCCNTHVASIMHGFRPRFNVFGIFACVFKVADENAALLLAR